MAKRGETREKIIYLLNEQGPMTAAELAEELGLTSMGARLHLQKLEQEGYVAHRAERRGVGRPRHVFYLTEKGKEELFPKAYDELAIEALQFIQEQDGEKAVETLFYRLARRVLDQFGPEVLSWSPEQKLRQLAEIRGLSGYEVIPERDGYSLILKEHNCPILKVAQRFKIACEVERRVYERIFNAPVEREECQAQGSRICRFRIRIR